MQASMQGLTGTTNALAHGLAHGSDAVRQGVHGALATAGSWGQGLGQTMAQMLASRMHDLSIAALAIAVATLGAVMLLELRALARLRASVDLNLARVFEQLDLLRLDQAQLRELPEDASRSHPLRASLDEKPRAQVREDVGESRRTRKELAPPLHTPAADHGALAAGEARLMASLAEARARRAAAGRD